MEELDRAERQKWVDRFRTHEKESIGKIFADVWKSNKEDWKCKHLPLESGRSAREKELEAQVRQLRREARQPTASEKACSHRKKTAKVRGERKAARAAARRAPAELATPSPWRR